MKDNLTHIAVVLDRSGSMGNVRQQTIDNFNEFVRSQMHTTGDARLRLVQFDHEYEFLYDKPLDEVKPLNLDTFVPRGSTALLDAIGTATEDLGFFLSRMPERDRPGKVVVLVLTDGHENASTRYNRAKVADMIKHQREKYNWVYIFMGAAEDAVTVAQSLNIPLSNAIHCSVSDPSAFNYGTVTTSDLIKTFRQTGAFTGYTSTNRGNAAGVGNGSAGVGTKWEGTTVDKEESKQTQ